MDCTNPRCGAVGIVVSRTAGGKISAKCHKCQWENWGPTGTKAQRDMLALMKPDDADPDDTTPPPKQLPGPDTVPKHVPNSAFNMANL